MTTAMRFKTQIRLFFRIVKNNNNAVNNGITCIFLWNNNPTSFCHPLCLFTKSYDLDL